MYIIFEKSKKPILSIFIFFSGCYFFHSLNAVRQYIAIVLVLLAYKYILEDSYKKFIMMLILAFFIHYSSIVCVVALLLKKKLLMKPIFMITLIMLILIFSTQFSDILNLFISKTYYKVYVNSVYDFSDLNKSAFILNTIIYFLMYIVYKYKLKQDKRMIFYLNIQGVSLLCITMGSIMSLFMRISFYFSILQIISVPYIIYNNEVLNNIEIKIRNRNIIINDKIFRIVCLFIILTIYSYNIIHNNVINNVDEVVPYKVIFNKEI